MVVVLAFVAGGLHGHLEFGLEPRAMVEVDQRALEREIAEHGLFLKCAAFLGVTRHSGAAMALRPQAATRGWHDDLAAPSPRRHHHALRRRPYAFKLLPGTPQPPLHDR